ncbi:MAG: fibronectin type III domain-containing protein [Lachnospiraceae bacterium]|nr:fibronectin type III domain-containing protein [Lachnospiraceae bacterium]
MLAMFIMFLGFSTLQTNAATITNASNLNMPKANYTGTFTENNNSARYYKFTVTTPGCMKVDLVADFYQRILLLSSTGDEIYHTRISKSYSTGIASVNKDINLEAGSYYIMIEARNSGEYGLYNLSLKYSTFAPAKPSAPYVVSYGNTAVKLSWYKVTDAVGYTIYQKKGSTYKAIKNTTATTATIKGLKTGTAYAFRIRAYVVVNNKKNYSPYSDTCFTATKPAKNKITSITKISKKKSGSGYYLRAKIKWSKSSGANRYKVYYKVSGSSYKSLLGTYKGTSTTIQQYRSKYSTGKRKYTFYVVPVKYYNGKYYEGAMSSGKTYTFK